MTSHAETLSRRLPRGWMHLVQQLAFWICFYLAYQLVRGWVDRDVSAAFWHGFQVIRFEERMGALFEPTLQRVVDSSQLLVSATMYTYWLSQFAVVGLSLLWVYFRHHDHFARFRNWLIGANLVGLIGYALLPTAPPRMFPEWGFVDTLAKHSNLNHESGLIVSASNPYAAMPSLHAMDAFIVAVMLVGLCRSRWAKALWLLWPGWVWFSVMGTGNHYWLDVLAGVAIALVVGLVLSPRRTGRGLLRGSRPAVPA